MSCGFAMKLSTIKINVHNLIENKYVISLDDSSVNPCPPVPGAWKNSPSISHITHDTDSAIKKAVKNRSNYIMDLLINYEKFEEFIITFTIVKIATQHFVGSLHFALFAICCDFCDFFPGVCVFQF